MVKHDKYTNVKLIKKAAYDNFSGSLLYFKSSNF